MYIIYKVLYYMAKSKQQKFKGVKKFDKDSEDNPLLRVDSQTFNIEFANILNDPYSIIFNDYETFDIMTGNLDANKINRDSQIIGIMRYYEYVCIARFKYDYIIPLLTEGDLSGPEVFQMIQHALRTRLLMNIPSFDVILEIEFKFTTKIKYT